MKNLINANIFARSYCELMIRQNESYFFAFDIFDSCLHRDTSRVNAQICTMLLQNTVAKSLVFATLAVLTRCDQEADIYKPPR